MLSGLPASWRDFFVRVSTWKLQVLVRGTAGCTYVCPASGSKGSPMQHCACTATSIAAPPQPSNLHQTPILTSFPPFAGPDQRSCDG